MLSPGLGQRLSAPHLLPEFASTLSLGTRQGRTGQGTADDDSSVRMKVTINHYHAVAAWKWQLNTAAPASTNTGGDLNAPDNEEIGEEDDDDDDDNDDVCGICRVAFDGCCPDCKVPGDGCPPSMLPSPDKPSLEDTLLIQNPSTVWGECTHVFHFHCLTKWLATDSSKGQCPMDRRQWGPLHQLLHDQSAESIDEYPHAVTAGTPAQGAHPPPVATGPPILA